MAMKLYSDVDIRDIADAIREVNGESTTYKVSEMAAAIRDLATEPWSDTPATIVAVRSVPYFNPNTGLVTLDPSNTEGTVMATTPNSYQYTDRNSNTVYLLPVDAKAKKVTVNYTGSTAVTYRFEGLKDNGGTFTRVFDSTKQSLSEWSFPKASADYILVSMERINLTGWGWGETQTATVTFSN